jgi:hypothetical protein
MVCAAGAPELAKETLPTEGAAASVGCARISHAMTPTIE